MDVIEIILLIICSPFIIGAVLVGWAAMAYGLGFCIAIVLDKVGVQVPIEQKPLCLLGILVGVPILALIILLQRNH